MIQPSAEDLAAYQLLRNETVHGFQLLIDRLHHERDHQNDLRFKCLEVLHEMADAVVNAGVDAELDCRQHVYRQAERMVDRQHGEQHCSRLRVVEKVLDLRAEVTLSQHNGLGYTCRSRGEHDCADRILRLFHIHIDRRIIGPF